jgi:CubicO group peptidase (beta-lactamase class C family)
MKKASFFTILIFVSLSISTFAQNKVKQIDDLIAKYNEYRYFTGSALVADNYEVVFKKGYGLANVEWNIPNTPDTKFRIGSITKQFTSMLIMQLVSEDKIKLDGKLTDYLPYYRKDTGEKITIEMLLTHTSGIPSYTSRSDFGEQLSKKFYKPDNFVKEYCSGDLEFEPGKQFVYNNSGYFILGAIIEKVTGKTYEEVLKSRIFEPLGMSNSGYDWHKTIIEKRASGYDKTSTGFTNSPWLDMSLPYAAGSLYSTVEDLLIWDKALRTDKLLSKKFMDEIFKGRVDAFGGKYAFGWGITKKKIGDKEYDVISHGGGINGFNTINYIVPAKGLVVVLFSNAGGAPLNEITDKIISILNGGEAAPPKKSLVQHISQTISEDGIETAVKQFSELKNDKEIFTLSESEMNQLGYEYLEGNKVAEAIAVFKMNTDAFPKSYNVYDSYAEALLKSGDKEGAITNYQKSLEINPGSQSGITALKNLGVSVEERKDAEVSAETLNQYVGKYQLAPNFVITITTKEKQIFAQATGQPQFEIYPESETKFYFKVVEAKIEFIKDGGKVAKLILFQNGKEMPAAKVE